MTKQLTHKLIQEGSVPIQQSILGSEDDDGEKLYIKQGITTLQENEDISRLTVTRSNRLVEAQIQLSTREQKVLAACIALINPQGHYPNGIEVELRDEQIEALTGIEKRHIYRFIDDAAYNYHKIPIATPGAKAGTVDYINIAHRSKYDPEERVFRIRFHDDMESELLQLSQYTSVHLRQIVAMTSKYSIRLFDLIERKYNPKKGGQQHWKMTLDEIYFPLGIKDAKGGTLIRTYIEKFGEFNRQVLKPSVAEINDKTTFTVEMTTYQIGRRVGGVIFTVRKEPALKIPEEIQTDVKAALENMGFKASFIQRWLNQYSEDVIKSNLRYLKHRMEMGSEVQNPLAYLNTLLKHNIAGLPEIANPYADRYKSQPTAMAFVKYVVMPIWWELPEQYRAVVADLGSFMDDVVADSTYKGFIRAAKESGIDEAVMLYESEIVLHDWLNEYKKNQSLYE